MTLYNPESGAVLYLKTTCTSLPALENSNVQVTPLLDLLGESDTPQGSYVGGVQRKRVIGPMLQDVELKYSIAGGLLVKVEFCGVCFSDMFP